MISAGEARGKMENSSFISLMRQIKAKALDILSKHIVERAEDGYNFLEIDDQDPEFATTIFNIPEFQAKTRRDMFHAELIESLKANGYKIYNNEYELKNAFTIKW